MAISFVAIGAVASITGTGTLPLPAGIVAGDLLIGIGVSNGTASYPTGWNRYSTDQTIGTRTQSVFYKIAGSSETAPTVSVSGGTFYMLAYRGANLLEGVAKATGTGTSAAGGTFSTTNTNDFVVNFYGGQLGTNSTWTAPASTNVRLSADTSASASGLLFVDELQASAGTTTSRTATMSASIPWGVFSFAIASATPRTLYWVGGSGTWDTSTTTKWSTSSGGAGGASPPTYLDNVIIDSSSGTGTITCTGAVCNNLTVTASQAITLGAASSTLSVYGDLTFPSGGSFSASAQTITTTFAATSTGKNITTNGKSLYNIVFNGSGGGWTFQDALTTGGSITLSNGSLDTNSKTVSAGSGFTYTNVGGAASLTLGTSQVTIQGTGTPWGFGTTTGLTFSGASSTIVFSGTGSQSRTFAGGGLTYGNLVIAGAGTGPTFAITGNNTFNSISSTRTTSCSITFAAGSIQTITTWSLTGTSSVIITVSSNSASTRATLNITNRTSGIDYLDIAGIIGSLSPVTFYVGSNCTFRQGLYGIAQKTAVANEFIYVLNSGTSWTVPADWNSSNNEIHLFGGGGGGGGSSFATTGYGGGGGGGGGYTKITNFSATPGSSVSYAIGSGGTGGTSGSNSTSGGTTTFNSGAYTAGGGGGGKSTATSSTGGTGGTGSTFNGGNGGLGANAPAAGTGVGGGGGGGSGGPLGNGGNGGNGFAATTNASLGGGGGGGNGGGTNGGNASSGTGGTGGNNSSGVGGGASATIGFDGGGSGGDAGSGTGGAGNGLATSGIDITKAGMGGGSGAGGGSGNETAPLGFSIGSGGGGGGFQISNSSRAGGLGGAGAIIIVNSTSATPIDSNFFLLF